MNCLLFPLPYLAGQVILAHRLWVNCVTLINRKATATETGLATPAGQPAESLAMISSGLCFCWGIPASSKWLESHTSGRTTFQEADHSYCSRTAHLWAEDLVMVMGPDHEMQRPPFSCSKCKKPDIRVSWRIPAAAELVGLTVRRPVRKIERWIWRDKPA